MSQQPMQDWSSVTWTKRAPTGAKAHDDKLVNEAMRKGQGYEVERKIHNQGNKKGGLTNAAKIEEESEVFKTKRVGNEFKTALQKARQAKGLTQADLAKLINEKSTVINEYEAGKAIPNGQVIQKLNRALGCTLPKATA
jgi:putative transcription factor